MVFPSNYNQKFTFHVETRICKKLGKIPFYHHSFNFQVLQGIAILFIADYYNKAVTIFPDDGNIQYTIGYISGRTTNRQRQYFNILRVHNLDILDPTHPYKKKECFTTILTTWNEIKAMLPSGFILLVNQQGYAYRLDAKDLRQQLINKPVTTAPNSQTEIWY